MDEEVMPPPIATPVIVGAPAPAPTLDGLEPPAPEAPKKKAGRPRKATPPSGERSSSPRNDARPKAGRPSKDALMTEKLADIYGFVGLGVAWFAPEDGRIIIERSEACAASLVTWSKESAPVAKFLDRLVTTSAIGAVITAHVGLGLAIAANHGLAPVPNLAAGDGETGFDGLASSPAAFPPGFDLSAIMADPEKLAHLGAAFDVDLTGAGANGAE